MNRELADFSFYNPDLWTIQTRGKKTSPFFFVVWTPDGKEAQTDEFYFPNPACKAGSGHLRPP